MMQTRQNSEISTQKWGLSLLMRYIKLFYQIHKRLNEIFSPGQDISFDGKSIVICEDLYQLLPVNAKLYLLLM